MRGGGGVERRVLAAPIGRDVAPVEADAPVDFEHAVLGEHPRLVHAEVGRLPRTSLVIQKSPALYSPQAWAFVHYLSVASAEPGERRLDYRADLRL
jgi:hypothetical protein